MKAKELLIAGLVYVVAVTVTYFIAVRFTDDAATPSQIAGTIIGVLVAIWLYQSRNQRLAPLKVKLSVGVALAIASVLQSLIFQRVFHWMTYPDIGIFFGAVGALIFPLTLWNSFGKTVPYARK